ncbi:MAG TPA: PAS domain-containing sensor histidine kinase [Blastocatellia bacterium]|nr:PAS domain-containing sensor histidine kinase [Blastocatellia bacterium]
MATERSMGIKSQTMGDQQNDPSDLLEQRTRELEASEARFRNVISKIADGIIITDREGIVRFINPAAESLFDRTAEELIGTVFGFPVVAGETTEIDILRRGGQTVVAEMRVVETDWEAEKAYLASLRDITDRKRVEAQRARLIREQAARAEAEAATANLAFLAEASETLASSLNYEVTLARLARLAVPFLADYCIVDMVEEDGSLRQIAVAHADHSKEELLRELRRLYPFDMNASYGVTRVVRSKQPEIVREIDGARLEAMARDQKQLELMRELAFKSYIIVPLLINEKAIGAISLVLSDSDRRYRDEHLALAEDLARRASLAVENTRLYRQAQQASRLKDEFLATVSHELRTPLNAILGWAHMLRKGIANPDRAIETIERNAKAQAQIIEDLLDVSRIITGKLTLKPSPIDVSEVVHAAVEAMRPAADAKGIRLQLEAGGSAEPIWGDADRLQQVIWNLLSNAIKFSPKDASVTVTLRRVEGDVEIAVSDTGKGISRDFLPYVFDRFRQADGSITREHSGLGLGLAIARHLVEMHGGTIRAESEGEGLGACFTVRIPRL